MESEGRAPFAWQPLTPAGVAAFAAAPIKRLWLVQLLIAILATAAVLWFFSVHWFPVFHSAIRQIPGQGTIRSGKLVWEGDPAVKLADNNFLALALDMRHEGLARSPAHVQVEFGEKDILILSIFGALQVSYPQGYSITCSREELEPWWGAWSPAILALTALAVILGLMLSWAALALLYAPAAWLVAFFANRDLTFAASFRLCGAALMPGALFLTAITVLYGLGAFDVLKLLLFAAAHVLIGWGYVAISPFFRPRLPDPSNLKANPFKPQ